ncbi:MAG: hypothetical protein WC438_01100 [Candidatus Pacearchaeota archaeon]
MAKLPIERMSEREFDERFKQKHLDSNFLDNETLDKIRDLFGLSGEEHPSFRVCCDDYHAHGYKCLLFYNPAAGVVERLINEIRIYQNNLEELRKQVNSHL